MKQCDNLELLLIVIFVETVNMKAHLALAASVEGFSVREAHTGTVSTISAPGNCRHYLTICTLNVRKSDQQSLSLPGHISTMTLSNNFILFFTVTYCIMYVLSEKMI